LLYLLKSNNKRSLGKKKKGTGLKKTRDSPLFWVRFKRPQAFYIMQKTLIKLMENEVRLFPLMTAVPLGVTVESLQQRNSDLFFRVSATADLI
jgi:hypothetical protein